MSTHPEAPRYHSQSDELGGQIARLDLKPGDISATRREDNRRSITAKRKRIGYGVRDFAGRIAPLPPVEIGVVAWS